VDYADAAIECGDPRYAEPLFDLLAPWADQLPATGASALAPVSHYLGGLATVLKRYEAADAYFSRSAAFSARVGAKFFAARTHLYWGKMLAERGAPGDRERARELLGKASGDAVVHGYRVVERHAAALVAALHS